LRNRSEKFLHIVSIFRRIFFLILLFSSSFFLIACSTNDEEAMGCTLPPKEFTEADLVGTWVARNLNFTIDTLILRADSTYKQIIHLDDPATDYESDWLPWSIEYDENGFPYLHMDGMRLCAYAPDLIDCEQVGGGEENQGSFNSGYWYDYCKREMVLMPNGGTLIAVGVPERFVQPPRSIRLRLLMYTESSWVYELESP